MMGHWIFDYPAIPMSIAAGLVFALVVAVGIAVAKRLLHPRLHGRESANHVVETTLTVFSAFYGILLGLLAVGAYENINSIDEVVAREASAISVLYWNFEEFPQPARENLQTSLRAYAQELVDHSFEEQSRGLIPKDERRLIRNVFDAVSAFEPRTTREDAVQREALRRLGDLQDARAGRLSNVDIGIPGVLWWIVGLGAAITLLLICVLDFPIRAHLAFGCLLAFFIGAMIYVIAAMDHPLSGADRVGPQRIQELLDAAPPPR